MPAVPTGKTLLNVSQPFCCLPVFLNLWIVILVGSGFIWVFDKIHTTTPSSPFPNQGPKEFWEISINFLNCQTVFPLLGNWLPLVVMSESDLRHRGLMFDDYQMLKAPSILLAFLHSEAGHSMPSLETGQLFSLPPSGQRCANSEGNLGEYQQCAPAVCQVMFWAALCLMPTNIREVNFVSFVLTNKGFKDIKQLIILNR